MIPNLYSYIDHNRSSYSLYTISDLHTDKIHIYQIMLPIVSFTNESLMLFGILPNDLIKDSRYFILVPSAELYYKANYSKDHALNAYLFDQIAICTNPRFQLSMSTLGDNYTKIRVDTICLDALTSTEMYIMSFIFDDIMKFNVNMDTLTKIMYNDLSRHCYNRYLEIVKDEPIYKSEFGTENMASNLRTDFCKIVDTNATIRVIFDQSNFNDLLGRIHNSISTCLMGVPMIDRVVYNAPNTVVFWNDGTKTTVTATEGEEFNKEIGLAMAISKKYFDLRSKNPRAEFKKVVKNADDYTEGTKHRQKLKEIKKQKQLEAINGLDADI